ncbi:hypothetical protein A1O1_03284 [Capronia coronata CBS 617.96]|uniref:D-isomer specific 2-hydroxyacid dehydrogenase NAD-binding domain-containing protein n=1 Tax=Capronia coronata CBS 617.96 TaxID=1182541 RepID=W9YKG7_9EURO|nr:uncharacterized protein A1O1_03284 [Capronia coronata CBS 617.96]EXJ90185.1 hypothetical protein A1O1_03284 [Capronia coronata CBS 617.96]
MDARGVLISVSRGGTIKEEALLQGLLQGSTARAAVHVFDSAPAAEDSPCLVRYLENQVMPYLAWFGEVTVSDLQRMAKENVEGWKSGNLLVQNLNVVV